MSLICPVFEHAQSAPNEPALICDERSWSYRELDHAICQVSHFLAVIGINKGERIAFIAKSHPQTIFLLFALFRLGATACPLSFRLPQEQIAHCLKELSVSHILDPEILCLPLEKLPPMERSFDLSSPATLLFTSGSSGTPKAACHSLGAHFYSALGAIPSLHLDPSSRFLLSLPLFHVGGLGILFRCFYSGAAVVLSSLPWKEVTSKFQVSHLSQVPTQLHRLLKEEMLGSPRSLKCLLLGGAPVSTEILQKAQNRGFPVFTTYGMTEMSSMVTLSGKLLPFRELKVDESQEIWVRGKTLFDGYWDPREQMVAKIETGKWHPTKDLGRFTESGDLEIIGRRDRQFISGGENIQPEEIEKALCNIPGILQASVLPVDDPEFGQRPVAFIHDETTAHTLATIREALQTAIPSFKHPIAILAYPEGAGLKPSLSALKEHLEALLKNRE